MKVVGSVACGGFVASTFLCMSIGCASTGGQSAMGEWSQWGGPDRNFMVATDGLADTWPEDGPAKLWHRELGDGYSSIVADGGVLYTMYGTEDAEFTVALDAGTGKTIWERKSPGGFAGSDYGRGPHSTPLVSGRYLFTIGASAVLHCLDKTTGKVLWKHDLAEELGAPIPQYGYACSPIAYNNMVIVPVDRKRPEQEDDSSEDEQAKTKVESDAEGQSLVAFDQASGKVVWRSQDLPIGYSSPILINFAGEDQLILLVRNEMMAVNPGSGELLWRLSFGENTMDNISTPVWNGKDSLFFSAAYNSGSRVVKLTKKGGKIVPTELWYSRKLRIHHGNAIRIGDYVYGSNGDWGTVFFVCMDLKTGKRVWADRDLAKVNCVYADGKLIALDEDGELVLATVTPEGLTIHSRCQIAENQSWTAPTLVGKTLYVRDRKHIMALDLG